LALGVSLGIDDTVICPMTVRKTVHSASMVKKSFTTYLHGRGTLFKFSLDNCWVFSNEKKLKGSDQKYTLLMRTMLRRIFLRSTGRALQMEILKILAFLLKIFSSKR